MDKLKMMSKDNVQANIAKIQQLFPNAVTEVVRDGKPTLAVDFDVLKQEMSSVLIDDKEERYQFTWPDKKKSILLANSPISATLRPCVEESVDFDNTQNLYIEGDNLDVLKLLQETYLGKIKMIYIDPPYNTGNDFVYNDDFTIQSGEWSEQSGDYDEQGNRLVQNTESNGRFHTDWLNMIYPRLKVAKDLLSDDGVIFISIDDNEIDNLKKVCDEVFSANSLISIIGLEITKTQGMKVKAAKDGSVVKNYEYVFCYAKNAENKKIVKNLLYDKNEGYDTHFSFYITKDDFGFRVHKLVDHLNENEELVREFKKYGIIKNRISIDDIETGILVSPKIKNYIYYEIPNEIYQEMACSINVPSEIDAELNSGKIVPYNGYLLSKSSGGKIRQYGALSDTLNFTDEYCREYSRVTIRGNLWKGFYSDMMNVSKEGDIEYKNGKKPKRLIKQLAKWIGLNDNDIVLDFFAGSATTAHAIMEYNLEQGKTVKYVLVQLNENLDESIKKATGANKETIKNTLSILDANNKPHFLSELGKLRICRVGRKIKQENPLVTQDLNVGFRVLKLDSSNMKDVYYRPSDYRQDLLEDLADNIKEDRTPLDLLFQVMLELGKPLSAKIEQKVVADKNVYVVDENDLIACFDENITEEVVKTIAQMKPLYVTFRDSSFANDTVATNFDQIFATYSPNTTRKVL